MKQRPYKVIHAAAVRDATGVNARPGSVLIRDGMVCEAGEPESLSKDEVAQAEVIHRPNDLLLPGFVNAHTHLELTAIGPQPYDPQGGFVGWVKQVRREIAQRTGSDACDGNQPQLSLRDWYTAGVEEGARQSVESCVQGAGDIRTLEPDQVEGWRKHIHTLNFAECFGLGSDAPLRYPFLHETWSPSIQPHAPYSAGPSLYKAVTEAALRSYRSVSTHLAETLEEVQFVAHGDGPWLDYLREINKWHPSFAAHYGQGLSPVQWMRPYLEKMAPRGGWLVAHCNYVSDMDISILADTNSSVAYCPIASEYFGHGLGSAGGHRYRDMLAAGVNVCLGTDSIICQPADEPQPLGMLAPMRRLYERDGTDVDTLLAMATVNGAKALRLSEAMYATLRLGADARFACVAIDPHDPRDPLEQIMTNGKPAVPLWLAETAQVEATT